MNEMESVREKILLRVVIYLRLSNEDRDKINKDDDINYYEMESYAYDINRKYDKEKDKSDDFEIGM